ncbi:MAG TPA: thiamine-phosphate kinase [Solirubrobacterales bacterium]|jgi:thiamine-monophosphate kinase|nr:thiamine-phosphate kinase [Solirubrobacterales bacterium]
MGEFELLARVRERLPPAGPRVRVGSGDDAAVTVPGAATATSVDALVEGVHFRRDLASPEQIGRKALATALSDLAAMGAEAGEAYVVLGVPPDLDEDGCIDLLDGLLALAATTETTLAGGDVTRAGELFLAITVVGHAPNPEALVGRAGAHPGDALVLTDEIGGAAAGLWLLENRISEPQLPGAAGAGLRTRQLEPRPRLGAGRALAGAGARAMIDLSDGLGGDAVHLAEASGVALRIDGGAVPRAGGADEVAAAAGRDPWQLLCGGEDYELLASIPAKRLDEAAQAVRQAEGIALTRIGEVAAGSGVEIRLPGGRVLEPAGFDQLA